MDKSADAELPRPLPWLERAGAMVWLPGTPEQVLDRLAFFLDQVENETLDDHEIEWPDTGERLPTKTIIGHYGRCGLFNRSPARRHGYTLTDEARIWLENRDPDYLVGLLHANVRFVGELLQSFDEKTSHERLRDVADEQYGLGWKTYDQIRRRTLWLRAAGFVELWSNLDVVITPRGRALRDRLACVKPEDLPHNKEEDLHEIDITPAPPIIRAELEKLTQARLRDRKRAISYIPGGEVIGTITDLVIAVDPQSTREEFYTYCENTYGISQSSADSALGTLRSGGVIEQTGQNSFSPTDLASAWLESEYSVDLVRILHCHFIGLGETLAALASSVKSGQISRYLTEHHSIPQLPAAEVTRRVRVLHSAGLLDRITQFDYRINALGRAFLDQLPLLFDGNESGSDGAAREGLVGQSSTATPVEDADDKISAPRTDPRDSASAVADELLKAAFDSAHYVRLERATAAAFSFLGFSAQHLGLSGRTDVLLTAWLAPGEQKTIIVDAKSSSAGVVEERAVQLDVLEEHREKYAAEYIGVVGPEFAPRLKQWAINRGVALIRTQDLAQWIRRHGEVPLSLARFIELFQAGSAKTLRVEWEAARQRKDVFAGVIQKLWECAKDATHIQVSGGALNARDLWLLLRSEYPDAQLSDIESALKFLSSELVGAVRRGKSEGFVLIERPAIVVKKLRALTSGVEPATLEVAEHESSAGKNEEHTAATIEISASASPAAPRVDPSEVRAWALEHGITTSVRGRLSNRMIDQYREAHGL